MRALHTYSVGDFIVIRPGSVAKINRLLDEGRAEVEVVDKTKGDWHKPEDIVIVALEAAHWLESASE